MQFNDTRRRADASWYPTEGPVHIGIRIGPTIRGSASQVQIQGYGGAGSARAPAFLPVSAAANPAGQHPPDHATDASVSPICVLLLPLPSPLKQGADLVKAWSMTHLLRHGRSRPGATAATKARSGTPDPRRRRRRPAPSQGRRLRRVAGRKWRWDGTGRCSVINQDNSLYPFYKMIGTGKLER